MTCLLYCITPVNDVTVVDGFFTSSPLSYKQRELG